MNYTYTNLWQKREQYKAISKLVNTTGFSNGETINKLLEIKREIKQIKRELREPL